MKNIELLHQYGTKSLLKWTKKNIIDFVIATNYNKKTQSWDYGEYYSVTTDRPKETMAKIQNESEIIFFLNVIRDLSHNVIPVNYLTKTEQKLAHDRYLSNIRSEKIVNYLKIHNPDLLDKITIPTINHIAVKMTHDLNENDNLITENYHEERKYIEDKIIPHLQNS